MSDSIGDRMKAYERRGEDVLMPGLPALARMDGISFHAWTRDLGRPFDTSFSGLMEATAKAMAVRFGADAAYRQSDEITLGWSGRTEWYAGGRVQKLVSHLAAWCTAEFNRLVPSWFEGKRPMAAFDARVFQVPSLAEAANCFLWREQDAAKNSVNMAASALYSHKQLEGKHSAEKQEMIFQKGINWNDYPAAFKRGAFFVRRTRRGKLSPEDIEALPPMHDARRNPELEVERQVYERWDKSPFSQVEDRPGFLFGKGAGL